MAKSQSDRKKELKGQIKKLRDAGYSEYISLSIASTEEMEEYVRAAASWSPDESEPEPEETPQPIPDPTSVLQKIAAAKTLRELGQSIAELSGLGAWKDWKLSYWDKNGECRIYVQDLSYTNPKNRGYVQILADGSKIRYFEGRDDFPKLPILPIVENNIEKAPALEPHMRAIASLNRQFGEGGWTQADLDDELEREKYR
jgi:hypothetical protein